jgi:hypothetical protein
VVFSLASSSQLTDTLRANAMEPILSPLLRLPAELIEHIASHLQERTDVLSLRLSCWQLHTDTFRAFGKAFFTTVNTDLSLCDTERLDLIAEKDLSKYTTTLCVSITGRNKNPRPRMFGSGIYWFRSHEERWLDPNNTITQRLAELLPLRYSHCTSFRIRRHEANEGPEDDNTTLTAADAAVVLLQVLALTGHGLQSFEAELCFYRFPLQEYLDFHLPLKRRLLSSAWDFVRYKQTQHKQAWETSLTSLGLVVPIGAESFAIKLLNDATNLRVLKLHRIRQSFGSLLPSVLEKGFSATLTSLTLNSGYLTKDQVLDFLYGSRSVLSHLSLFQFEILCFDDTRWSDLFCALGLQFPQLESIALWALMQHTLDDGQECVFFCPLRQYRSVLSRDNDVIDFQLVEEVSYDRKRVTGVQYRGKNMKTALDILARRHYLGGSELMGDLPYLQQTEDAVFLNEFDVNEDL